MPDIIFIDDEKLPAWFDLPEDTPHAKNAQEALDLLCKHRRSILYLDHDLGKGMDGKNLLELICQEIHIPNKVFCISLNPAGVKRISDVCKDYNIEFENIAQRLFSV